jgi:hypothetical protein
MYRFAFPPLVGELFAFRGHGGVLDLDRICSRVAG